MKLRLQNLVLTPKLQYFPVLQFKLLVFQMKSLSASKFLILNSDKDFKASLCGIYPMVEIALR